MNPVNDETTRELKVEVLTRLKFYIDSLPDELIESASIRTMFETVLRRSGISITEVKRITDRVTEQVLEDVDIMFDIMERVEPLSNKAVVAITWIAKRDWEQIKRTSSITKAVIILTHLHPSCSAYFAEMLKHGLQIILDDPETGYLQRIK